MLTVLQDLRFGARLLRKHLGFTLVTVLTLALGIGACTAIFSVVYAVLLRPLPFPEPNRLMQVWEVDSKGRKMDFADPNFRDVREATRQFEGLAEYTSVIESVSGAAEPTRTLVTSASDNFFSLLQIHPLLGRTFLPEENRFGGPPAVIVSYGYWQRFLGGDPNLAAHHLIFENKEFSIVAVMPAGFSFPPETNLWIPRGIYPELPSRTAHNWRVLGRLAKGSNAIQARSEMSSFASRLKKEYGDQTWMNDIAVVPLQEQMVGKTRPALLVLLGAVGFLLLVACANVANLLLARTATRHRELGIRLALGAPRRRIIQQFLSETLMFTLLGGVGGVFLSFWGMDSILAWNAINLPRQEEIGLNIPVLLFALGLAVLTSIPLGLLVTWRATRSHLTDSLGESQRTPLGHPAGRHLGGSLVVVQVALAVVLLIGSGLLGRSLRKLLEINPGFQVKNILAVELNFPGVESDSQKIRRVNLVDQLLARFGALPGVEDVGLVNSLPLGGDFANGTFIITRNPDEIKDLRDFERLMKDPSRTGYAEYRVADKGYFRAMQISLIRGRMFEDRDGIDAPHVAVISESLARTRWPNEDPLGKLIEFGNMDGDPRLMRIVGIVGDVRDYGLDTPTRATFYSNFRQRPQVGQAALVLRTSSSPSVIFPAARGILNELAPDVPPKFETLRQVLSRSVSNQQFNLLILGVFGCSALLLAVAGIFGVMTFAVSQRTREIGVRMALGAETGNILRMILQEGGLLLAMGLLVGLGAAWGLTRLMQSLLFGVRPTDPLTYLGVVLLLSLIALAACYFPARQAARIDPMDALRHE